MTSYTTGTSCGGWYDNASGTCYNDCWNNIATTTTSGSTYYYTEILDFFVHKELIDKRKAEVERARARAKALLLETIDEQNKQRYLDKKPLEIPSKLLSGVKYNIPTCGRITAWKENKIITELCLLVKTKEELPPEDIILTKLLYMLHDEECVLRTAKHFNIQENLLSALDQMLSTLDQKL